MRCLEDSHIRTQNFGRNGRTPIRGFGILQPLPEGLQITAAQLTERCVVGDPAAVLAQVRDFQDMGMSEFIALMDFGQSQRDILRSNELFGAKVIAQDWTSRVPNPLAAVSGGHDQEMRRRTLAANYENRLGRGWREWREREWIEHFDHRRAADDSTFEIFDL